MRSRRPITTPRSRRGTILILAAVAFLLQGVHVVGLPQGLSATPARTVASASPKGDGVVAPPPGGSGNPGPTLTVPPPPGVPIPENAVLLYTQSPSVATPSGAPGTMRPLNPPEILRGLLLLHRAGKLDLPRDKVRELLEVVEGMEGAYTDMRAARDEILQVLTPEQLQWLEEHPPSAGEIPDGAPEQNAEEPARKALEALGP